MLTDYTTITRLKLAYEKVTHNLGYISVIRKGILNFNNFGYLTVIAKNLMKLIFAVFKLQSLWLGKLLTILWFFENPKSSQLQNILIYFISKFLKTTIILKNCITIFINFDQFENWKETINNRSLSRNYNYY